MSRKSGHRFSEKDMRKIRLLSPANEHHRGILDSALEHASGLSRREETAVGHQGGDLLAHDLGKALNGGRRRALA